MAKYWKEGKWDFETFEILLKAQPSGAMAIDYMSNVIGKEVSLYPDIISKGKQLGYSDEILSKVYHLEATWTENVPLVSDESDSIKELFWVSPVSCRGSNARWAVEESKKYASLGVFLWQLYCAHHENPLSAGEIFFYMEGIERIPRVPNDQMTDYYMKHFLEIMQREFLHDDEKCLRIAQIEIIFTDLLKWDNMKCFHHLIKRLPGLFVQLVAGLYKKDHDPREAYQSGDDHKSEKQYWRNMYTVYDKAHFCPAEENGEVEEEKLRQWVGGFKNLLEQNDQSSLFGSLMGRRFAFSPKGKDGHEPCEAVRAVIEDYCDDRMRSSYESTVYNRRGVYSPSAGRAELRMAEDFRANAEYLAPGYPETARILYDLYDTYKRESERERMEAENGQF